MTDEARIARLTELARRVWGEHGIYDGANGRPGSVAKSQGKLGGYHVLFMAGDGSYMPIQIADHPRALDALEAALLVLAGELVLTGDERSLMRPDIRRIVEANADLSLRYSQLLLDIEQLASKFDAETERLRAQIKQPGNGELSEMGMLTLAWCARELRECAKGKGER